MRLQPTSPVSDLLFASVSDVSRIQEDVDVISAAAASPLGQ